MQTKKIVLAMSGGTDSSAAAILLQEQGYEVYGLFIIFYDAQWAPGHVVQQQEVSCNNVKKLCNILHIPCYIHNASQEFYSTVISYFVTEYIEGRTPFPCAKCNPLLKWKILYDYAVQLNCNYIATGHYVNIELHNEIYYITQGIDSDKDQSFFLWGLTQDILQKAVFPLGGNTKQQVREYARSKGFVDVATRKDSLGVCFLGNTNYRSFVTRELAKRSVRVEAGKFVDEHGNYISNNKGYVWYTVGQRKQLGLNINTRMFVKSIDAKNNTVTVSPYSSLFRSQFVIHSFYFHTLQDMQGELVVKVRYRNQSNICTLQYNSTESITVILQKPLEAIAPGQTAVFYKNNRVVGGGFID